MKAIFITNKKFRETDLLDPKLEKELFARINEFSILESHIVYFYAGDSKIKEILIKKEPIYSAE